MPIGDIKLPELYYVTKSGKFIPISELKEINYQISSDSDDGFYADTLRSIDEFCIVLRYRRKSFPAELRFPKKHRRQANIDRKKRKMRRKSKWETLDT